MVLVPFVRPETQQSAGWVPVHLVYFATLLGILLVLVGIFARQPASFSGPDGWAWQAF